MTCNVLNVPWPNLSRTSPQAGRRVFRVPKSVSRTDICETRQLNAPIRNNTKRRTQRGLQNTKFNIVPLTTKQTKRVFVPLTPDGTQKTKSEHTKRTLHGGLSTQSALNFLSAASRLASELRSYKHIRVKRLPALVVAKQIYVFSHLTISIITALKNIGRRSHADIAFMLIYAKTGFHKTAIRHFASIATAPVVAISNVLTTYHLRMTHSTFQ